MRAIGFPAIGALAGDAPGVAHAEDIDLDRLVKIGARLVRFTAGLRDWAHHPQNGLEGIGVRGAITLLSEIAGHAARPTSLQGGGIP